MGELITRQQIHMGTFVSISVLKGQSNSLNSAFLQIKKIDNTFSSYKPSSPISKLNRGDTIRNSSTINELIQISATVTKASRGVFRISIGTLTKGSYPFGIDQHNTNNKTEISTAIKNIYESPFIKHGATLKLKQGAKVDFGGIAKGFAVDKAVEALIKLDNTTGSVSASGDIQCLKSCKLAIRDPFSSNPSDSIITFTHTSHRPAISTSGPYENKNSSESHHLISPTSGKSQSLFYSVSFLGNGDSALLDGLTTAAAIGGWPTIKTILKSYPKIGFFLITKQRKIFYNHMFDRLTADRRWSSRTANFKIKKIENI